MGSFPPDILIERRRRAERAWGDRPPLVLVAAGRPVPKPGGADQCFPFVPHPAYYWLTGRRRPGGVLAYDPDDGWTHFVKPVSAEELLWEGGDETNDGVDVEHLDDWLQHRGDRPIAVLGSTISDVAGEPKLSESLAEQLDAARRPKDASELELLRRAVAATAAGFARARQVLRPGATERQVQIELEAEMFRYGADSLGYDSIVGAGPRAAILHSTPGEAAFRAGDLALIDAGGAIGGYTADVTRTLPVGGAFSAEQQAIYDLVLAAESAAIGCCRVGVEWHDVHRAAAGVLAAGLRELGILLVDADVAIESEAIAMFFPHGIGHMVGLGVRDVGGRAPGREEGRLCAGARVRVDLPLERNFLMTVEPGIYFVPALLDDPERRDRFRGMVGWDQLERWRAVGGVRIEDNVLITSGEPEVLTAAIAK